MKFVISSSELLKGLLSVSKAIPSKSAFPMLENFLFVLKGNVLEITASDEEIRLTTEVEVENTAEEGQIAVPATHILDLLKALPDQPITIGTTGDSSFECTWSTGKSTFPYFQADAYPEAPAMDNEPTVSVDFNAGTLLDGINGTVYATADDEMRPTMCGVYFDIEEEFTTLVASDSHKLVCYTLRDVKSAEKSSFILNKKPTAVIRSIIDKNVETVQTTFNSKYVMFKFNSTTALCRLVVGKYPRYRDVIPQNNANILQVGRSELLNTVRRVAVCANKASGQIKLDLRADYLKITSQDLSFSISAEETIACQYNGDDLTIGFKAAFLGDILSNMNCDNLIIKFSDSKRAALIIPAPGEDESDKVCGILMPILI
ncbi:MAG: DNA polymerase III subunit beta [Bacteroidales bacterium]|nr:DNA polymerase III subunit beta [Bacteroidales bacterium]